MRGASIFRRLMNLVLSSIHWWGTKKVAPKPSSFSSGATNVL
jgi:hypothetical protein